MNKYIKIGLIGIVIIILFLLYFSLDINKKIYMNIYPKKYEEYIQNITKEYDIDELLIMAIIKTESNFKEDAISKSGAIGLMQLMTETAAEEAAKIDIEYSDERLLEPETNLKLGISYYNTLLQYYNNNYILAFTAYNAGIGNVNKWIAEETIKTDGSDIENIPFKETNLYVRKVIKNYEIYKKIYES